MNTKQLLICFIFYAGYLFSNVSPQGFEEFLNYYFVETGTHSGDGIRFALRAGFSEIHSVEIHLPYVQTAKKRFSRQPQVHIWHGDSSQILFDVIKDFDKPITFWFDGHNSTPDLLGRKNTPLLEELEQVKWHHIKTHTILIDDMHCCDTILFDWLTKEDIINKIKEINPDYVISYVDGGNKGEYKNNIMVARVLS